MFNFSINSISYFDVCKLKLLVLWKPSDVSSGVLVSSGTESRGLWESSALWPRPLGRSWQRGAGHWGCYHGDWSKRRLPLAGVWVWLKTVRGPQNCGERDAAAVTTREWINKSVRKWMSERVSEWINLWVSVSECECERERVWASQCQWVREWVGVS